MQYRPINRAIMFQYIDHTSNTKNKNLTHLNSIQIRLEQYLRSLFINCLTLVKLSYIYIFNGSSNPT